MVVVLVVEKWGFSVFGRVGLGELGSGCYACVAPGDAGGTVDVEVYCCGSGGGCLYMGSVLYRVGGGFEKSMVDQRIMSVLGKHVDEVDSVARLVLELYRRVEEAYRGVIEEFRKRGINIVEREPHIEW